MVRHCPEQLSRLAGRAHQHPLPVLTQQALGDSGHPPEVFQVRGGYHLIEVFQSYLVLGNEDYVLGLALGLSREGPKLFHLSVHRLQGINPPVMEHLPEGDQHVAHRGGVVTGPVVVEGGQIQALRHDVQLVLAQIRQQVLGQNQGIHIGGCKFQSHLTAARPDEAYVKLRIVGR